MSRHRIIVLIIAGVLVTAFAALLALTILMRKPLAGDTHHDFGIVDIAGENATIDHVFQLTNRTNQTLYINHMIPSCGCTRAEASTEVIEPGADVEIATTFSIKRSGHSESHIDVFFEDDQMMRLDLEAVGRLLNPFQVSRDQVRLRTARPTKLTLWTEVFGSNDAPAEVEIEAPSGVAVTWDSWRQMRAWSRSDSRPSRWQSALLIEAADASALGELAASSEPAMITLRWPRPDGEVQTVELPIEPILPQADASEE